MMGHEEGRKIFNLKILLGGGEGGQGSLFFLASLLFAHEYRAALPARCDIRVSATQSTAS